METVSCRHVITSRRRHRACPGFHHSTMANVGRWFLVGVLLSVTTEGQVANHAESTRAVRQQQIYTDPFTEGILRSLPSRAQEILQHGLPGVGLLRVMQDFVLSYDTRFRVPHWVMELVTPASLGVGNAVNRSEQVFYDDEAVHPFFRSENRDYSRSGFDRGHLAPAGNHKKSSEHQRETFILSNIAPQVGRDFNRGIWNRLENYVRDRFVVQNRETFICTGTLFLPVRESARRGHVQFQVIGRKNVAVPTHFFKVIVADDGRGQLALESYVMPNQAINGSIQQFLVPKEDVEKASGLLLFSKIPKDRYRCVNRVCKGGESRTRG